MIEGAVNDGTVRIIDNYTDATTWNDYVTPHPYGHIYQTWEWGELQVGLGAQPVRIAAIRNSAFVGALQLLVFDTGTRKFAYAPRGPVADPADAAVGNALNEAVLVAAFQAGADFIRIEPQWTYSDALAAGMEHAGWTRAKQFIMPRRTILVDLRPTLEEIWLRFRSNTRNRIRLAEKLGVRVRVGDAADVQTFIRLSEETASRHGMRRADPAQYAGAWDYFGTRGTMRLYVASSEDRDLAALMVFVCGPNATYLWGASSAEPDARQLNPNQILHWTAMQWARESGCVAYDLHGIPDYDEPVLEAEYARQTGGMWNLYRFKRGFGGVVHRFLGTYDRVFRRG
jgi:peptidoglycan pentaglycine glycine transferase (the first glycine)